jgi:hypothetical protein
VKSLDQLKKPIEPMKIEIVAAARSLKVKDKLPCTVIVNEGHYRRKAVKQAESEGVLIMDWRVLPTMNHFYFFERKMVRDLVFYHADPFYVSKKEEAVGDVANISGVAEFTMINRCAVAHKGPRNLDFVFASKDTWLSIKVPPDDVDVRDWLMRFVPGYVSVKFESPVWSWKEKIEDRYNVSECCGVGVKTEKIKSGDTVVYVGEREKVQ